MCTSNALRLFLDQDLRYLSLSNSYVVDCAIIRTHHLPGDLTPQLRDADYYYEQKCIPFEIENTSHVSHQELLIGLGSDICLQVLQYINTNYMVLSY